MLRIGGGMGALLGELSLNTSNDNRPVRSGSETYLTEDPLSSQQFGAQANDKAKHC